MDRKADWEYSCELLSVISIFGIRNNSEQVEKGQTSL